MSRDGLGGERPESFSRSLPSTGRTPSGSAGCSEPRAARPGTLQGWDLTRCAGPAGPGAGRAQGNVPQTSRGTKGNVESPSLGRRKADRNPPSSGGAERWEEVGDVSLPGAGMVWGSREGEIRSPSSIPVFPVSGGLDWELSHGRGCVEVSQTSQERCAEVFGDANTLREQRLLWADTYPGPDHFGSLWKQILPLERLLHLLTICSSAALVSKTVLLYFISSVCLFCLYLFCLSSLCCLCSGQVLPI